MRRVVIGIALLVAFVVEAQWVSRMSIVPAAPTTQELVHVRFWAYPPCQPIHWRRVGNEISIFVPYPCGSPIPELMFQYEIAIGYLPAGDYVVTAYDGEGLPGAHHSFAVADAGAPFVPTLSQWAMVVLTLSLAAIALRTSS